jgi:site-specific DNA-methyltransferase (adenine-specific)
VKPYYQDESCTIYHGDCREILPDLEADALVSDPPYGVDWNFSGQGSGRNAQGGRGSKYAGMRIVGDAEEFDPTFLLGYSHVALWGFHHFPQHLSRGTVLVWVKKFPGAYGTFLSDADLAWVKGGSGVYLSEPLNPARFQSERVHPTQKPVEIMAWTIEKAGGTGTVLDPFMGSGTTLRAAKNLGRKAIGIEIEERYCEIAASRLGQEVLDLGMAA